MLLFHITVYCPIKKFMKIMIVDDSPLMREIIGGFVRKYAQSIVECSDGNDVLMKYEEEHPDIVLMDIQMQQKDGITATKELCAVYPDAKVFIITQFNDALHRKLANGSGAAGFIAKENLHELSALLEAA